MEAITSHQNMGQQQMSSGGELYPWLVYEDGQQCKTFCRISSTGLQASRSELRFVPESQNAKIMYCSSDGCWFLLLQETETDWESPDIARLLIWNPVTRQSIGLPPIKKTEPIFFSYLNEGQALLSSSPADPKCLVYIFVGVAPLILYCRVGDENWSKFWYAQTMKAQMQHCLSLRIYRRDKVYNHTCCHLEQPVSFNGSVYALDSCNKNLVQISVDTDSNRLFCTPLMVPKLKDYPIGSLRVYLVSWGNQELYRITISLHKSVGFKCVEVPEIMVSRFCFGTSSPCWDDKQVMSLNGGAIFLSSCNSLALPSCFNDRSGKWSSIYFPSAHNQMLYEYRMEDERIRSCSPCPMNLSDPWLPLWIMPADQTGRNHWIEHWCRQSYRNSGNASTMVHVLKRQKMMVRGNASAEFCNLTPDVLNMVAENLFSYIDYVQFGCITKACEKVGPRKNPFHPCLVYREKVNGVYQYHVTDSNLNQKLSVGIPEELRGRRICCSRDGWLLLGDGESYSLFNLFTNQVVETVGKGCSMPSAYLNLTLVGQLCSSAPENCWVLETSIFSGLYTSGGFYSCNPAKPGKAEWWGLITMNFVPSCNSGVLFGGFWYYLGRAGNLGRLMLSMIGGRSGWKWRWEVLEGFTCPCEGFTRNYLTECGGDLVSVFTGDEGKEKPWARVFRMGDHQMWEEMESLKGHSLYLGLPSSMSCFAGRPDMADRLYFPRFHSGGLVYFSLKTKKYHSVGDEQSELKNTHCITMFSSCAWIKPEWIP